MYNLQDIVELEARVLSALGWEIKGNNYWWGFSNPADKMEGFSAVGETFLDALKNAIVSNMYSPYSMNLNKSFKLPLEENHSFEVRYFDDGSCTVSILHVLPPMGEESEQFINAWFADPDKITLAEKMCNVWLKLKGMNRCMIVS